MAARLMPLGERLVRITCVVLGRVCVCGQSVSGVRGPGQGGGGGHPSPQMHTRQTTRAHTHLLDEVEVRHGCWLGVGCWWLARLCGKGKGRGQPVRVAVGGVRECGGRRWLRAATKGTRVRSANKRRRRQGRAARRVCVLLGAGCGGGGTEAEAGVCVACVGGSCMWMGGGTGVSGLGGCPVKGGGPIYRFRHETRARTSGGSASTGRGGLYARRGTGAAGCEAGWCVWVCRKRRAKGKCTCPKRRHDSKTGGRESPPARPKSAPRSSILGLGWGGIDRSIAAGGRRV